MEPASSSSDLKFPHFFPASLQEKTAAISKLLMIRLVPSFKLKIKYLYKHLQDMFLSNIFNENHIYIKNLNNWSRDQKLTWHNWSVMQYFKVEWASPVGSSRSNGNITVAYKVDKNKHSECKSLGKLFERLNFSFAFVTAEATFK